ncbi:hypothetical protein MTR_2g021380 [Medicago truncatula]|uniref:Uncharacterized protein n=1 Tax=Medicago truncatula TaxID=3880 RepID=G7IKE5_MEDTR|nr:hypothetical protein MTR_2g021380 [Medicago truncatula]
MDINSVMSHKKSMIEEEDGSQSTNGLSNDSASASAITNSPTLCRKGHVYNNTSYELEEESLINFKRNDEYYKNLMQGSESIEKSNEKSVGVLSGLDIGLGENYSCYNRSYKVEISQAVRQSL